MISEELANFLEEKVDEYNQPGFIENDPISIPHSYSLKQDIEITGFWVSMLAWGQRKTIITKAQELFSLMDNAPYDFIKNHSERELEPFLDFKHRTFNATDTLHFIRFFKAYYAQNESLEAAFSEWMSKSDASVEPGLVGFHNLFFSLEDSPDRTRKHIATPARKSACKRMNMFLRWMVRKDNRGVDFGLWNTISPSQLVMPLDVHVEKVARHFGLLKREPTDWQAALELTNTLRSLDPEDPVKYDFALFGLGLEKFV